MADDQALMAEELSVLAEEFAELAHEAGGGGSGCSTTPGGWEGDPNFREGWPLVIVPEAKLVFSSSGPGSQCWSRPIVVLTQDANVVFEGPPERHGILKLDGYQAVVLTGYKLGDVQGHFPGHGVNSS